MRCAEVGAPYGQAIYNLLPVAVIFVLCPSARIIGNIIIPYHIIVFIAHNMVVKRPLPQIASGILIVGRDDLGAPSSRKTEINI